MAGCERYLITVSSMLGYPYFENLPYPISEMNPLKKSKVMKQFLLKQRQSLIGDADIDFQLMTSDIHVYANATFVQALSFLEWQMAG